MKPETIAQMAILNWIDNHFGMCDIDVSFTDKREAYITDKNGDTMSLIYDGNTKEVYAV